jgi:hypothetical protein
MAALEVAVYCGRGGPVTVAYQPGALAGTLYAGAVDTLRPDLERKLGGGAVTSASVVLWRVSLEDAKQLRHGGDLSDANSKLELDPDDAIAGDTFSDDHRVWVQLIGAHVHSPRGLVTQHDLASHTSLLLTRLKEMLIGNEGASSKTPADYEDAARPFLRDVVLPQWLGLLPLADTLLERAEGESPAFQWDFRAPVRVSTLPPSGPPAGVIVVYPSHERYRRPSPPHVERHLTPTKVLGATERPVAHFVAIFEVTTASSWPSLEAGSLLWRLEERLTVSLQRATAQQVDGAAPLDIADVVAVVGVVGAFNCRRSVSTLMARSGAPPLLRQLMQLARFVFVN